METTLHTNLLVNILVTFSALTVIFLIRRFINILPEAFRCTFKWKEAVGLEYSVKLSRDRNSVYLALIIPFCLLMDRYAISFPRFMTGLNPMVHLGLTAAIFILYTLLRSLMKRLCRRRRTEALGYNTAFNLFRTVFCIAVPVLLATVGILSLTNIPLNIVKTIILDEVLLFYILFLWRETEILRHYCSVLTTILYLCGLEFVPALFLVILWIV